MKTCPCSADRFIPELTDHVNLVISSIREAPPKEKHQLDAALKKNLEQIFAKMIVLMSAFNGTLFDQI